MKYELTHESIARMTRLYDSELGRLNYLANEHKKCALDSIAPTYFRLVYVETSIASFPVFQCAGCNYAESLASGERYENI